MLSLRRSTVWSLLCGVLLGASYGVFVRWGMRATHSALITVISIAFVFLTPFTMGFVSVVIAERESSRSVAMWVFLPWIPVLLGSAASREQTRNDNREGE